MSHAINHYITDSSRKRSSLNCISNQFRSVVEPQTKSKYWIGGFQMDDMLSDIGSLNASLVALRDAVKEDVRLPGEASQFTQTQLYFLSKANTWCHHTINSEIKAGMYLPYGPALNYHRTVIPVMNSHDFAEAFNCPVGSPMNPVEKCQLW